MTTPRYVYAIGRALDPADLAGLVGIDGAEVHRVAHRDLVAVVSAAPSDEAALTARLERLDELAAVAEAHHAVVAAVATPNCGRTLPARHDLSGRAPGARVAAPAVRGVRGAAQPAGRDGRGRGQTVRGRPAVGSGHSRTPPAGRTSSSSANGTGAATRSGSTPRRPSNGSTPRSTRTPSTATTTARSPPSYRARPATTSSTPPTWYPPGVSPSSPSWPSGSPWTSRPCGSRSPDRGRRTRSPNPIAMIGHDVTPSANETCRWSTCWTGSSKAASCSPVT